MTVLQIIGGGRMGQALASGLVRTEWCQPSELAVVDPDEGQRQAVGAIAPGVTQLDTPLAAVDCLVALKPHLVCDVVATLQQPSRILSVAAGVRLSAIEAVVPAGTPVIRGMPNTPALVGLGASGLAAGTNASAQDMSWAAEILGSVGLVVEVSEAQLSVVTGLSGSGPAYIYLIAEAMVDAAVADGLTRPQAETLAHQTIRGAGAMLAQSGMDSLQLRAAVTTPGGTTAAGLAALESLGARRAVAEAVKAATARERAIGDGG